MEKSGPITGVLLAAGKSRRFGSNKLLERLPGGITIGLMAARNLTGSVDELLVVVKDRKDPTSRMFLDEGYKVVVAENAKLGMGNSLKSGVRHSSDSYGWMIALADMPFISTETIHSLSLELLKDAKLCAPVFQGVRGHPVCFSRALIKQLLAVDDSDGAANLVSKYRDELVEVQTNDRGVLHDIDVPDDLIGSVELL